MYTLEKFTASGALPRPTIRSHYFEPVMKKVEQLVPTARETIQSTLEKIDEQGFLNFSLFTGSEVTLPITKVAVDQVAATEETSINSPTNPRPTRAVIIVPGFAPPPNGHPFTPWDAVYDRVITESQRHTHLDGNLLQWQTDVWVVGSANSYWGKVSPEWLEQIKTSGYQAHAKVVYEFLRSLPHYDHILINGISAGSVTVSELTKLIPRSNTVKYRFLIDNPATHNYQHGWQRLLRAGQLIGGAGIEAVLITLTNPYIRQALLSESSFLKQASQYLDEAKGIIPSVDELQQDMKKQAAWLEGKTLLTLKPLEVEHRIFTRRGINDLTTVEIIDVIRRWQKKFVYQSGNYLKFMVPGGHQRDNFRVERWAKILVGS